MQRTITRNQDTFNLPPPAAATFNFSVPDHINIAVPATSKWRTEPHWHTPNRSRCIRLETEKGRSQITDWREPRTGCSYFGNPAYTFKPDYWVTWANEQNATEDLLVILVVQSEALYRNTISATLDASLFPSLRSTPYWLRAIFVLLDRIDWTHRARRYLISKLLYIQIQAIYYHYGYWEYHGGINALRWWQWTHPFDIGDHPAWTISLQFKSQRIFSRGVQALYYYVGKVLGMEGEYAEYNPRIHRDS